MHILGQREKRHIQEKLVSAGFPGFANGAFELEMRYLVPPERTTLSVSVGQCPCAPSEFRLLRQTTGLSGHSRLSSPDIRGWTKWSSSGLAIGWAQALGR